MTKDHRLSGPEQPPQGWALWAGRGNMVRLAAGGVAASVLLLAIGIALLAMGQRGAVPTGLGAGFVLFWIIAIPLSRRMGKL